MVLVQILAHRHARQPQLPGTGSTFPLGEESNRSFLQAILPCATSIA
jgi:hypothetical protein